MTLRRVKMSILAYNSTQTSLLAYSSTKVKNRCFSVPGRSQPTLALKIVMFFQRILIEKHCFFAPGRSRPALALKIDTLD